MELNILSSDNIDIPHKRKVIFECGICHSEIISSASIYQEGFNFGVVCKHCYENNSPEDIELMANMFLAYGGYFGKLKNPDFSLYKLLKQIVTKVENKENVEELHIKYMHNALLNGVTPKQFIQGLRILLE
jgi:hypothetical protein